MWKNKVGGSEWLASPLKIALDIAVMTNSELTKIYFLKVLFIIIILQGAFLTI